MTKRWQQVSAGDTFGRLTVIGPSANRRYYFDVVCECGARRSCQVYKLLCGDSTSCGSCIRRIHGGTTDHPKELWAWYDMRRRCLDPKNRAYNHYGGRGITVCERWLSSFEAFLADLGKAPSKAHSLERIDVDGNYEPNNCKWATKSEQTQNRRCNRLNPRLVMEIRDLSKTKTQAEISRLLGIPDSTPERRSQQNMEGYCSMTEMMKRADELSYRAWPNNWGRTDKEITTDLVAKLLVESGRLAGRLEDYYGRSLRQEVQPGNFESVEDAYGEALIILFRIASVVAVDPELAVTKALDRLDTHLNEVGK